MLYLRRRRRRRKREIQIIILLFYILKLLNEVKKKQTEILGKYLNKEIF
jgi:hypothetical protein